MLTRNRSRRTRGGAMLELALLSPWFFFLFVGLLDWGFYAYSLITLETATRAAVSWNANHNDAANTTQACKIVTDEMQTLINMSGVSTCGGSSAVSVSATAVTGPDSAPAAQVSVTYTTPSLIPIPGLLAKQFTITRVVVMRV
jgi:Flp pilus assembly protein TadG